MKLVRNSATNPLQLPDAIDLTIHDEPDFCLFKLFIKRKQSSLWLVCSLLLNASKCHQQNMSVKCIPSYTLLLYSKTGVYSGIPILLIVGPKHRFWVLIRTASARRF